MLVFLKASKPINELLQTISSSVLKPLSEIRRVDVEVLLFG